MDSKYVTAATAFHGSLDTTLGKSLDSWVEGVGVETVTGERHIVTQTRTLSYRFYPHFHPYVRELAKRLIEKSVAGLEAADTEYIPNSDGTFQTLPSSFQVALPVGLVLHIPRPGKSTEETEAITLPGNITVTLPDGVKIKLADGNEATLPGSVIAHDSQHGVRVRGADGKPSDLDNGASVSLSSVASVTLPEAIFITGEDGKLRRLTEPTSTDVPVGTTVQIQGGKPRPTLFREIFSKAGPFDPSKLVQQPYPVRDLDFSSSGAYSVYNWELFYHIPLAVAIHLSKNQRYEDAQRWFHFIFDPTDDSDGATPERFWKVKPFQYTEVKQIQDILVNLSSGADSLLRQDTINSINAWKDTPFRPHLIARYRQTAYMFKAVMAYLDNLIAWGDDLFRQDTGETINEATQIYVLAALILGERPQLVPQKGTLAPLTYASKRGQWDEFDNTLEKMESEIPFDLAPLPMTGGASDQFATLHSISASLYFCVPRNDKLMSYWDTVADRLFKIRNSLNIQGIFRQLPLFEPPIDPALLARAAAAGVDIGAVVAGINQPLPLVRSQLLIQKATEICQEVKSLGNNLLSAIEKEDNEALALLRAQHEKNILTLAQTVKYAQLQEAIKNREGLETSLANAVQRYIYYERMLNTQESDIKIPVMDMLDTGGLTNLNFQNKEPGMGRRPISVDIAQNLGDSGGKIISSNEAQELDASHSARDWQVRSSVMATAASLSHYIPTVGVDFHFWGLGGTIEFGGQHVGPALQALSEYQRSLSAQDSYDATMAAKIGTYARREQDWAFQSGTIVGEINQIFKQLRAAQIRESMAEREWRNHQEQIKQAQEIEDFLTNEKKGKKTNQAFYTWLKGEVRGLYTQAFQFAFDVTKQAALAVQQELGRPDLTFLQFGYMSGKEGLLAGEKLYFDLKRMEMAYHELNRREYELTKHVSLLQIAPMALMQLRTTGNCTVTLPEALFDMDGPGHYFRRIKTVALSIPCVAGPYTSVNCTLRLTKSSIRTVPEVGDSYARQGSEDPHFSDYYGSLQAIVTSTAQNDSGMFEANLHDERYLPFENSGVISEWQLELLGDPHQFDYNSISDVILHIRYTAREGGSQLREGAVTNLKALIAEAQAAGSVRLFSIRYDFPTEWARFKGQKPKDNQRFELALNLRAEHYPYWSQDQLKSVKHMDILARSTQHSLDIFDKIDQNNQDRASVTLTKDTTFGTLLSSQQAKITLLTNPVGELHLFFTDNKAIEDLWIAITWGGE